jgi:hypothetical protein
MHYIPARGGDRGRDYPFRCIASLYVTLINSEIEDSKASGCFEARITLEGNLY